MTIKSHTVLQFKKYKTVSNDKKKSNCENYCFSYAMVLIPPATPRNTIDSLSGQLLENGFRVKETRLGGCGVSIEM